MGLAIALAPATAKADVCELMDQATAEKAAELLREAKTLVYLDWFAPVTIETVEVRPYEDMFEVVVNDAIVTDAAYAYVPGAPGTYRNIGLELGCAGADVTPVVPDTPFAAAGGAPPAAAGREVARVLGVLELPDLFEPWLAGDVAAVPAAIRAGPAVEARILASTRRMDDFELTEFSYEETGATVHAVDGDWYRVRLDGLEGWIAAAEAGTFHPVAELLDQSLTYLETTWSGDVFAAPDRGAGRVRLDAAWRRMIGDVLDVSVNELREVDGELWVRLDVLWPGPCFGEEMTVIAAGWVPAYGPTGSNDVWFFSRGC
ncbi:MAG: hypothetical protein WD673_03040 [Alphaproteobacteria bacterium]